MSVFRDQCASRRDLPVLGKSAERLRRNNAGHGSSAEDNENDSIPRQQIPAFHSGWISGIHAGIQEFVSAIDSIRRKVK